MTNRHIENERRAELTTEWASERTHLARRRTTMANERTSAAWLRTGLGSVGGGFALVKVAPDFHLGHLSHLSGVSLMLVGLLIQMGVARQSRIWLSDPGWVGLSGWAYRIVNFVLILASALLLVVALAE